MPTLTPDIQAQVSAMMSDPNAMEQMSSMMGNLTDDQIEQMAAANPMMAGMDPDHVKKAAGMMKNMKPETMQSMMKMAQSMGTEGGKGFDPNDPDMMSKMQKELNNPEMREAMVEMIQGMDSESLKEMSKSMGMTMDDAQAEQAVNALKNISPKTMERMLSMASVAGGITADSSDRSIGLCATSAWRSASLSCSRPWGRRTCCDGGVAAEEPWKRLTTKPRPQRFNAILRCQQLHS